ncbi:MAG: hypothetical protein WCD68_14165, partial [Candidatus Acidiferrum sp.]
GLLFIEQVLADRYRLREEINLLNEGPSATGGRPFFLFGPGFLSPLTLRASQFLFTLEAGGPTVR